jgi:hypothetical protein
MRITNWQFRIVGCVFAFAFLAGCDSAPTATISPAQTQLDRHVDQSGPTRTREFIVEPLPNVPQAATTQPAASLAPVTLNAGGSTLTAPAGSKVSWRETETGPKLAQTGSASSKGSGFTGAGDKLTSAFDSSAPRATLGADAFAGKASADGGSTDITASLEKLARGPGWTLVVIGGMALLGGVVAIGVMHSTWPGAAVAGGGALLIVCGVLVDSYPWIIAVAGILTLAAIGWWVWTRMKLGTTTDALTAVTSAVAKVKELNPIAAKQVKNEVKANIAAQPELERVIRESAGA